MDLTITQGSTDDNRRRATIAVVGELDSDTAPQLELALQCLSHDAVDVVVIDLAGTTFVSSAGLSVLVGGKKTFDTFGIERGNRVIDRVVALTGLDELYVDDTATSAARQESVAKRPADAAKRP